MEIREEKMNEEFTKYHLEGFPFNAVLHKFDPLGKDAQIHDHPFGFTSFVIKGSYVEKRYTFDDQGYPVVRMTVHSQGSVHQYKATDIHAIATYPEGECWTLILPGPWERESLVWKFDGLQAYYKSWREGSEWKLHSLES